MNADDDLERRLDDHLAATARRMPEHVVAAVLDEVQRQGQAGPRSAAWGRVRRLSLAVGTAAAVIAVVVAGPTLIGRLRGVGSAPSPSPRYTWDATLNFREYPIQMNPSMDGYGNQTVWTYLHAPAGTHDPSRYVRFTEFDSGPRDAWVDPAMPSLAVGWPRSTEALVLHPSAAGPQGAEAAVVAWRSPVAVAITVTGSVEVDASCGDGITFWLDKESETLESFALPTGRHALSLNLATAAGETLYFGVEAGSAANDACDATNLRLTITGSP